MRILSSLLFVAVLGLALPQTTLARVNFEINLDLPVELPRIVEVEPGVRVVEDFDHEIFFVNGFYWTQRDGTWYRARDHRQYFRRVDRRRVPRKLKSFHPGQFRRYRHNSRSNRMDQGHHGDYGRAEGRGKRSGYVYDQKDLRANWNK